MAAPVALTVAAGRELPPRFRRFGELPDQLRAAPVALQRLGPQLLGLVLGPELERLAGRPHRIAVGVDGLRLPSCADQCLAGAGVLAGAAPLRRYLEVGAAGPLQQLGEAAV